MIITNNYNLPEPFYLLARDSVRPPVDKELHVTQLVNPAQLEALRRKHWDVLTQDCSDLTWALFGTALHNLMEHAPQGEGNQIREQRMYLDLPHGWVLTGQGDLLKDGIVTDYKSTTDTKLKMKSFHDWEAQVNVYAHMYRAMGHEVRGVEIMAFIRNWIKKKAITSADYPPAQTQMITLDLWTPAYVANYIETRFKQHYRAITESKWPDCTKSERWGRGERWAIKKKGRKNAVANGVHEDEEQAKEHMTVLQQLSPKDSFWVEHRPPQYIRCYDRWCPACDVCPQLRKEREN